MALYARIYPRSHMDAAEVDSSTAFLKGNFSTREGMKDGNGQA